MFKKSLKSFVTLTFVLVLVVSMIFILANAKLQAATSVTIDPGIQYQTMEGWGTSLCWWGKIVGGYPDSKRKEIEELLFDKSTGLGINIVRYNIGGGDDPTHNHLRSGGDIEGFEPSNGVWNWNADANQRKVLDEAIAKGVNIVEAFSNSPPYWMTNSGCVSGATNAASNNLKDDYYDDFAEYLTEVTKHFKDSWGVTFRTLNPLNEPNTNYWGANGGQEGCHFDIDKQNLIIKETGTKLATKGLTDTTVSAPDETSIDLAITDYNGYDSIAKSFLSQINTHTYGGSKRTELRELAKTENKRLWMSELDGSTGTHNHNAIAPAIMLSNNIKNDLVNLQPVAWVFWQVVENEQNMLRENKNWGLIHSDFENGGNNYYITKKFYAMENYCKFIKPGCKIICSNDSKTVSAFDKSSNSLTLVVTNDSSTQITYSYDLAKFKTIGSYAEVYRTSATENFTKLSNSTISNQILSVTMPANSITTYTVSGVDY